LHGFLLIKKRKKESIWKFGKQNGILKEIEKKYKKMLKKFKTFFFFNFQKKKTFCHYYNLLDFIKIRNIRKMLKKSQKIAKIPKK